MRVIHSDGRVGTGEWVHQHSTCMRVGWDEGGLSEHAMCMSIRPLGPIEEELWRDADSLKERPGVHWDYPYTAKCEVPYKCATYGEDVSEALEACARIWEQHGVAL